ncbi:MAG: phenylalanine--tRNA ligase subunit beta [Candidatus Omnitrophica bacterium]|nr:phenylalanine--tRNA ligase subunit beta [Candidatus Omnitrophota bacterium]
MKFTYNWIKDYVDIRLPPEKLAEKLTMAGLEVISLESKEGDCIFEVEITSNRPDWLNILGIAREIAAITGAKLKIKDERPGMQSKSTQALKTEVEDKKDCPLYTARIIRDIKVGLSPDWLRKRLESIGCRSVNNVVDITNYFLFETGEPLHAFDWDKISPDKIIVRRGKAGEKLTTIDGALRSIDCNTLVIADSLKPLALAGIMGGKESEVTYNTKNILLEAAVFNPILIRRTRQAHSIQSESSYRFERGVDLEAVKMASQKAGMLITELCKGRQHCFKSVGLKKAQKRDVILNTLNVEKVLGISIKGSETKEILSGLGFKLKIGKRGLLKVGIPSFRQDVCLEEDLIEEVARIFGYEHIPVSLPKILPPITIRDNRSLVSNIKNILVGLGLNEAITYSLDGSKTLQDFNPGIVAIELLNPLSREQEALRTTLIPGLTHAVANNLNQKQDCIALFEISHVFLKKDSSPYEELKLGIALTGAKRMFFNNAAIKDELGLLNLKGIAEEIFKRLKVQGYEFINQGQGGRAGIYINKEKTGYMEMLGQELLDKFGIKNKNVFMLEISLDKLISYARTEKKYVSLPKYPVITRDISFILQEKNSVKEVIVALKEKGWPLLRSIKVVDYYKGKQIPEGCRGLTIECNYGSNERTLTEEEVYSVHSRICLELKEKFDAVMR